MNIEDIGIMKNSDKLTSDDYQLLATLAEVAGFKELRMKCIANMFKDMKVIKK